MIPPRPPVPSAGAPGRCGALVFPPAPCLGGAARISSRGSGEAAWMIPPLPPEPWAGGPGGRGLRAARGRIAPPEPSIWSGSALVLTRMKWVGRDDTYRTSWSRNEGDGDAIDLPWWRSSSLDPGFASFVGRWRCVVFFLPFSVSLWVSG
jgi:hypothetical protein